MWVCIVLALVPASAQAGITYLGQNRFVSAANSRANTSVGLASGFSPMLGVPVRSVGSPSGSSQEARYEATAWQASTLGADSMTAAGQAKDVNPFYHYGTIDQSAQSHFEVVFQLSSPTELSLTGYLDTRWDTRGSGGLTTADLSLSEFGGADIFVAASRGSIESAASRYVSIDERLTLSAGSYVLEIDASTEGNYEGGPDNPTSGGGGSAMYDIDANTLALPAPAALSLLLPGLAGLTWLRRKVI